MSLRRITYVSRTRQSISEPDIRQIWGAAEVLHRRMDLSGLLAFTGPHFVQVIEGDSHDVETLMDMIRADTRHAELHVFCDETIERRRFDHWRHLLVESLDVVDEIEVAMQECSGGCARAQYLTERILQTWPDTAL
jgi:hypothetical protein